MIRVKYRADQRLSNWGISKIAVTGLAILLLFLVTIFTRHTFATKNIKNVTGTLNSLNFDSTVADHEKKTIIDSTQAQSKNASANVHIETTLMPDNSAPVVAVYVPIANKYSARQTVSKTELGTVPIYLPKDTDSILLRAITELLSLNKDELKYFEPGSQDIPDSAIAFIPISFLSPHVKLLRFDDNYYLDSFQKGAIFRQAKFTNTSNLDVEKINLNHFPTKDTTLKINMTGVTALTRLMMKKLSSVKNPSYFSQQIGPFLADADITHVSNEVSFKAGCEYSNTSFCAPPEMIETLKSSGVDLVEITGNHNNDTGNQFNTESINLYHQLGWGTFGGGLNSTDAAKPFIANQKNSKIAFLGYNSADAPGSGAIATPTSAGANSFDFDKIKSDIYNAKQLSNFVIVDIQFSECYAYPAGFTEFPQCDVPVSGQKETFRKIIDLGADMVIGTQAHQPQTYELYNGKPIFYGLGNLYFEQIQWPGTERGVILTHYFVDGKLLQTKLSPTIYDANYQTHLMNNEDAVKLLQRLNTARQSAKL